MPRSRLLNSNWGDSATALANGAGGSLAVWRMTHEAGRRSTLYLILACLVAVIALPVGVPFLVGYTAIREGEITPEGRIITSRTLRALTIGLLLEIVSAALMILWFDNWSLLSVGLIVAVTVLADFAGRVVGLIDVSQQHKRAAVHAEREAVNEANHAFLAQNEVRFLDQTQTILEDRNGIRLRELEATSERRTFEVINARFSRAHFDTSPDGKFLHYSGVYRHYPDKSAR